MENAARILAQEDDDSVKDGYKLFTVGEGAIVVTNNDLLKSQLSRNEKWFRFRSIAQADIFVSMDLEKQVRQSGVPKEVIKYAYSLKSR